MSTPRNSAPHPRILLCVHQFFPEFSAGTEVLVLSTAKALQAAGYVVHIATGALTDSPKASANTYIYQGFTIYRIFTLYQQGRFDAESALKEYDNNEVSPLFAEVLDQFCPDLVHFFHLKNLTVSCLQECFRRAIPTVFTPTDYWLACRTCQLLKPWGESECAGPEKLAGNCLRHVLINTKRRSAVRIAKLLPGIFFSTLALLLARVGLPKVAKFQRLSTDLRHRKSRIFRHLQKMDLLLPPTRTLEKILIDGAVSPDKIQPLRYAIEQPAVDCEIIARSVGSRIYTVGFIGTLVEHKGCHVLINALQMIRHTSMEVRIYGSIDHYPKYINLLKNMAEEDNRVRFCGTFQSSEIGTVLSQLDVLVIPSTWRENAPLVLLNAIACGVAVVASDVVGITEYLDPADDVTLFPAGDSRRLAQLLEERSSSYNVPRDSLQRASRTAGNSLETYASALDSAYTRLINLAGSRKEKK